MIRACVRACVLTSVAVALAGCGAEELACTRRERNESCASAGGDEPAIEVMHWLTTGGERAALSSMRDAFRERGGIWMDTPMPSVAAANATSMNRILGGEAPDFFQVSVGTRLQQLAMNGLVIPIPGATDEWDAVLPAIVAKAAKHDGKYVALPIDIHGENWMFFNRDVLAAANVSLPKNWAEFGAAAERIKGQGKIPIALGGQPWQERILFNSILVGIGGRDLYMRVYGQFDEDALGSTHFLEVFRVFSSLRQFVDRGSPGRGWSEATRMLIRGEAAFQFMGDWAKSEMRRAGLEPGERIGCELAPAGEPLYIMAVEAFALAASKERTASNAHRVFSAVAFDPGVQGEFNRLRGSIPARIDVPGDGFDTCAQFAMQVIKDPAAQLISTGLFGLSGGMSGAVDDAISHFWNTPEMDAEQGRLLFHDTVRAFRKKR